MAIPFKALVKAALREAYLRGYDAAGGKGFRTDAEQDAWQDAREEAICGIMRNRLKYKSSSVTTPG